MCSPHKWDWCLHGRDPRGLLCPLLPCKDKERRILLQNRPSPGSKSGALASDFPVSKPVKNLYCLQAVHPRYPSHWPQWVKALMGPHQLASLISSNSLMAYSYWGGSALRSAFTTSQKAWWTTRFTWPGRLEQKMDYLKWVLKDIHYRFPRKLILKNPEPILPLWPWLIF